MIDMSREVCVCNGVTAKEIRDYIVNENVTSLQALLDQDDLPLNDKCESCLEEGYENDGFNISLIFSLTQKGKI